MSNNSKVKVSVLCLAYNHAKYIRKTLEGFVSQKTNFDYEILVHDDASTDETARIINEYAKKYPKKIRPILQKQNQRSQKISIWNTYLNPLIRGKYVAICEGDDYWTDSNKLQRQYDVLENHKNCSMCVHTTQKIFEDGTITNKFFPRSFLKEGELSVQDFLNVERQYPFHTSSFFIRTDLWLDFHKNPPMFKKTINIGDRPLLLYMVTLGNIYYLPMCMSAYRMFSLGSWSSLNKNDPIKRLQNSQNLLNMMLLYDEYTGELYDCHLTMYKGDVLWHSENYSELIKKENRAYLNQIGMKRKLYIYVCALFPFLCNIRSVIRQLIQKQKVRKN